MLNSIIRPFIFWVLGYLYSLVEAGTAAMYEAHRPLRELEGVVLMLHRMALHLSGKVMVALHLDNSTSKGYLHNHSSTVSLFPPRLSCCTLDLAGIHGITLIPAYVPTHLNVETNYLSWGRLVTQWHLLPHIAEFAFQLQGHPEVDLLAFSNTNQYQCYYTLGKYTTCGSLGVE